MKCDICYKDYKGKIGYGVHLKRSHSQEERQKLYVKQITDLIPLIQTIFTLIGIFSNPLQKENKND